MPHAEGDTLADHCHPELVGHAQKTNRLTHEALKAQRMIAMCESEVSKREGVRFLESQEELSLKWLYIYMYIYLYTHTHIYTYTYTYC